MDFIHRQKQRNKDDPNTKHCMFGQQDGDLIMMLGLATHEPHFETQASLNPIFLF
jgi:5'-3' exonuclease